MHEEIKRCLHGKLKHILWWSICQCHPIRASFAKPFVVNVIHIIFCCQDNRSPSKAAKIATIHTDDIRYNNHVWFSTTNIYQIRCQRRRKMSQAAHWKYSFEITVCHLLWNYSLPSALNYRCESFRKQHTGKI